MSTNNEPQEDTRAIARQAVEADFRKKKRRGYDSSDDEAGGAGSSRHKKKSKSSQTTTNAEIDDQASPKKKANNNKQRPLAVWEVKYRDRAKERRQGKVPSKEEDHDDTLTTTDRGPNDKQHHQGEVQSLLEDVLDGEQDRDEGPLVKGLDRSMLEKKQTEDTTDQAHYVETREQALAWLAEEDDTEEEKAASDTGRKVLTFLRQHYLPKTSSLPQTVTRAGVAVQQTTYMFSTDPFRRQGTRAWETPAQESVLRAGSSGTGTVLPKASNIASPDMLQRMQQVLNARKEKTAVSEKAVTSKKAAPIVEEDIFQISDDEEANDEKDGAGTSGTNVPSVHTQRTFFFRQLEKETNDAQREDGAIPPSLAQPMAKLERLSQLEAVADDNDVEFDEEDEEDTKKKKSRKRRKKDGNDSD